MAFTQSMNPLSQHVENTSLGDMNLSYQRGIATHQLYRQTFFSYKVVKSCYMPPSTVVNAPSLNTFKTRLDRAWRQHTYEIPIPPQVIVIDNFETSEDSEDHHLDLTFFLLCGVVTIMHAEQIFSAYTCYQKSLKCRLRLDKYKCNQQLD